MKKGITILMLAIAVIIMSIISGIVVYFGNDAMKTARKSNFAIELLNIQNALNNYYTENGSYPIVEEADETVEFSVAKFKEDETKYEFELNQFANETIEDDDIIVFSKLDFGKMGIKESIFGNNTTELDVYVVSENTGKVYYLAGLKYNEQMHYTINNKLYDDNVVNSLKNNETTIRKKDVIFRVSDIEYTTNPVTMTILLPNEVTVDSVAATNSVAVGEELADGIYKSIAVNTLGVTGNYDVTVAYTLDEVKNTVVYNVENVDNVGPDININETANTGYVTLTVDATDDISGVKKIKYEAVSVTDKTYFKKYGKTLTGAIINCYESGTYTIYAEDNLGNITKVEHVVTVD